MLLRNHGTLTAGQPLKAVPRAVIDKSMETRRRIFSKGGFSREGGKAFAALVRKLDPDQPDYHQ
jgi:hypothetical protein